MTKSFFKEMEGCPVLMNVRDIESVLRISRRGAYRVMQATGAAFEVCGDSLQISRDDLIKWIDNYNFDNFAW